MDILVFNQHYKLSSANAKPTAHQLVLRNDSGNLVPSGMYFLVLSAEGVPVHTARVVKDLSKPSIIVIFTGSKRASGRLGSGGERIAVFQLMIEPIGIQVNTWSTEGLASMQEMSVGTGAVDAMGAALVEVSDSGTVSSGIVDMIATLATATPQDVNAVGQDDRP